MDTAVFSFRPKLPEPGGTGETYTTPDRSDKSVQNLVAGAQPEWNMSDFQRC